MTGAVNTAMRIAINETDGVSGLCQLGILINMNKEYAKNMRRARYRANLTQSQLAEKSGVNWATIQLWESATGNPSLKALELACKALNISVSEYIYGVSKTPCEPSGGLVGGQRMKACRILKHYTMCGLADKTGLSVSTIRSYENGRMMPTLSNLEKICDVLGVTIEEYTGIYPPKNNA